MAAPVPSAVHYTIPSVYRQSCYPEIICRGKINPAVVAIAKILFPANEIPDENSSLKVWNDFLQIKFLRKGDHQVAQFSPLHPLHEDLMPYFKALGLIDETHAMEQEFDIGTVFGGTPWDTYERYSKLCKEINDKNRQIDSIVYMNGDRNLDPSEIDWMAANGYGFVTKQHEAAKIIWDKTFKTKVGPEITFSLNTAPHPGDRRANSEDTLIYFFSGITKDEGEPKIKKILFVTNGPYGPYQYATAKSVAQKYFPSISFEVVSSQCRTSMSTISLLDTIARRFYTEYNASIVGAPREYISLPSVNYILP